MLRFEALCKPSFSKTLLVTLQLYFGQSWRISGPTSNKSCSRVYQSGTRSMSWLGRSSTISPRVKGSLWQPTKRFCCTFDKFELGVFWTHTGGRILSPFSLYSTRKYRSSLIREQPPPDDVLRKFWELGIKDKTGQASTPEEQAAVGQVTKTLLFENGQYSIGIPRRDGEPIMK